MPTPCSRVKMIFQNTPETEAPSNMNTYFPDTKLLSMAENVTGVFHNIYTLRGAPVRDALNRSTYISRALFLLGQDAEVMLASHHWPRWGNDRIQEVRRGQRNLYANINPRFEIMPETVAPVVEEELNNCAVPYIDLHGE